MLFLAWWIGCGGDVQPTQESEFDPNDLDGDGVENTQDCAPEDAARSEVLILTEGPYGPGTMEGACESFCVIVDDLNLNLNPGASFETLDCIVEVQNTLRYNTNGLLNYDFLGALQRVGGDVELLSGTITSLSGLDSLESAGGVGIAGSELESLQGLGALESVEHLRFDQVELDNFEGLSSLKTSDYIAVYDGQIGSLEGLTALESLNSLLLKSTTLGAWSGLPVNAGLTHVSLVDVAVPSLLELQSIPELESLWFEDLALTAELRSQIPPSGNLKLENIRATSFSGLNLDGTESVRVLNCEAESLSFSGISESMFAVEIVGNPSLTSLVGLEGLKSLEYLEIADNPALPQREIDRVLAAIGEENVGNIMLSNNGD